MAGAGDARHGLGEKREGRLSAPLSTSWKDVPHIGGEGIFLAGLHIGWISHQECVFHGLLVNDTQQEACLLLSKCEFLSTVSFKTTYATERSWFEVETACPFTRWTACSGHDGFGALFAL
jgi:hypothetical protein